MDDATRMTRANHLSHPGNGHAPHEPARDGGDVALLVDWENLKWSLQDCYRVGPNISSLVEASREYGRLVAARAYADWTLPRLAPDAPNLYRAGIEPVYIPSRHPLAPGPLKNSADIRLAVDAVDLCGRLPHIATYVLVTGDGDLIHAMNFLRLSGRQGVVIGVGETMNALLSAAADNVLLYERDIEPLAVREDAPDRPIDARPGAPALDDVFAWATAWLRERLSDGPFPLEELQRHLRRRYGLDARRWYGVRLKDLLLRAQRAGLVHLSVIGNVDHVSLPADAMAAPEVAPAPADEPRTPDPTPSWAHPAEVTLDALAEDEQRGLLQFLRALDQRSPFMTFKYVVDNVMYYSVLPRLARDQVKSLVDNLEQRSILVRRTAIGVNQAGESFTYAHLIVNDHHPLVAALLGLPAIPAGVLEEACADALAVVRDMGRVSGLGLRFGRWDEVDAALRDRLQRSGREALEPAVVWRLAEDRGLVRRRRLDDGADVALACAPEMELPAVDDAVHHRSIWYTLCDGGLQQVLRVLVTAEDRVKGVIPLTSLVAQIEGLVDSTTPAARSRGSDKGGLAAGPMARAGIAARLVSRDLVDAGIMASSVAPQEDETGGLRRTESYRLRREHPLVQRAIAAGPVALPAANALRRLA